MYVTSYRKKIKSLLNWIELNIYFEIREYRFSCRWPGFLAVVVSGSSPTPSPLHRHQVVSISISLFQSCCVLPVGLTDRRGGRRQIIRWRWRESLVLYKSFNTLCPRSVCVGFRKKEITFFWAPIDFHKWFGTYVFIFNDTIMIYVFLRHFSRKVRIITRSKKNTLATH